MLLGIKLNTTATYFRPIVNRLLYGTRVGSCHLFSLCTPREKYTAVYDNNSLRFVSMFYPASTH